MTSTVRLARSGLVTSRLAFGTSRLHRVNQKERRTLLEMAVDLGFTHIDTAPSYGDTLAEREIGRVLQPCRDRLVIATKYGIPPNTLVNALPPPLAFSFKAVRAVGRRTGVLPKRPPITAEGLRLSVRQSLEHLRTDWLDILLLHEPTPDVLPSPEEVHQELLDLQAKGQIRHFGLSGAWDGISRLSEAARQIGTIVQTDEHQWPASEPPDVTYGAISAGPRPIAGGAVAPTAIDRLRTALARRPDGVVLFSTTKPSHLREVAELAREMRPYAA